MAATGETTDPAWALAVVTDSADRGARFVLPAELRRGTDESSAAVRMTLTVPTPAVGSDAQPPPPSTAMDAVAYLACWAVGGLLLVDHWRLPGDDPFARQLQGVLQTLRLVVRSPG